MDGDFPVFCDLPPIAKFLPSISYGRNTVSARFWLKICATGLTKQFEQASL